MSKKSIEEQIADLEFNLGMARYAQAGYFPHPQWAEEEKRLEQEIKKLKKKLNGKTKKNKRS